MASITCNEKDPPTLHLSQLVLPQWIGDSKKVTLELDGKRHLGRLILDNDTWKFKPSPSKSLISLLNFALTYKSLLEQQLLLPRWHSNFIPAAAAAHVSASGLTCDCPESLIKALSPLFADRTIWHDSYMEELQGLIKLGTFHK
eukprot:10149439-Ditylum_brightwellii.AAC.1